MEYRRTHGNYYRLSPDAGERALPALTALLDGEAAAAALELRHAVQLWLRNLSDEEEICAVASVWPAWTAGRAYAAGEILRHGCNAVGDAQLYRVLQAHSSQSDWPPDAAASLYAPLGLSGDGVPLWRQPLGAADAYQTGDLVVWEGKRYLCTADGNVWSPAAYPAGWQEVAA